MENKPIIFVLAGANGIGKTTVNPFFIPKGVPYVNADDIARQLRERLGEVNVQEIANAQAVERMNEFIAKRLDLAIETNLADTETWQFLKALKGLGYAIHLNFFCVSDVEVCVNRVLNRVLQGGHFVHPDIVKLRYEVGLRLLRQNKEVPDHLILTDNSVESKICAELQLGQIIFQDGSAPEWVDFILSAEENSSADLNDIEGVREKYRRMRSGKL